MLVVSTLSGGRPDRRTFPQQQLPPGPAHGFADMVNYLRWEEELGHKYAVGD